MANQYVNKVQKSDGTTIIDITDTTATAADVATGKYFYAVSGEKTEGLNAGGNAFLISDTTDTAGGTIRTATAIEVAGTKSITDNGTYDVTSFASADVSVPASAVDSGTKSITTNGTHDVVGYASANVAVPASEVDSGTKSISISANGTTTHDVVGYASASITTNVPNSYSASDEGKVVSNGALVSQTAHADVTPTTSDQTIDTTTNNSIKVKGDADLVAGNIKKDVEIFGVTGSYEGGSSDNAYKFLDGSFSGAYVNNTITKIRNYAVTYYTDHDFSFSSTSATSLGYNVFQGASITSFSAPNLTGNTNNASAFNSARKLTFADMGKVTQLRANFAYNARLLSVLVLRRTESVVTLDNVNAFGNTPIRGYNSLSGTIYVPNALISTYKTATNWGTIFNEGHVTFSAIEGSQYEL